MDQRVGDILEVLPEVLELIPQRLHFGVARHAHVEFRVVAEFGEGHVGRSDDGRARLRVAFIPAQVHLTRLYCVLTERGIESGHWQAMVA